MRQIKTVSDLVLQDFPLFAALYELAKEGHKDQKRKTGLPYIVHIDAVIVNTHNFTMSGYNPDMPYPIKMLDYFISLAAVHDLVEDHSDRYSFEDIEKEVIRHIGTFEASQWIDSLKKLTKQKGAEYASYIVDLAEDPFASAVKLADLAHNMSDLPVGDKKSKYLLADAYIRRCAELRDPPDL